MPPVRIILDTDIGTDVDDCLALALILKSPEFALEAVTCVYGDVDLRARIALKLLHLAGRDDVPVYAGVSKPLLGLRSIYWEGHEGEGIIEAGDALSPAPGFAPDVIVRMVMDNPRQIHLLCIGPLTNAAMAFIQEPRLAENLAGLTMMGGVARGLTSLDLPYAEHNIRCDPEAAQVVLSSGAPITIVPLDMTVQVKITAEGVARAAAAGTPFHRAVVGQLERYPRYQKQGWTNLHDPLAAAVMIRPDFVTLTPVDVKVETGGTHAAGMTLFHTPETESKIRLATAVHAADFEAFFVNRLES